jgi:Flp pilus assembly pilin Flp
MTKLTTAVRSFAARETGATFAEYVLLCVLIALVCIVAVGVIGQGVFRFFNDPELSRHF